jgi:transcriptional regulator GlxA family with amidase domain
MIMNNVGIFLFNDIELLDFAGPYEVFSVTSELNDYQLFKVFTISKDGTEIKSVNGLKVVPDFSFDKHPPIDIFVIPGGVGTKVEMNKEEVLEWIKKLTKAQKLP